MTASPRLENGFAPTDLIWIQTGFIGDIVLTTAATELAARTWPTVQQRVITTPVGREVLSGARHLASLHTLNKADYGPGGFIGAALRLRREIRGVVGKRPVLLQPHRSHRSSLLAKVLGLATWTYRETHGAFLAAKAVPRVAVLHEAARIGLLLEPLGLARAEIVKAVPQLIPLPPERLSTALGPDVAQRLLSHRGPRVALAPGSVWGTKRWPAAAFAALAKTLLAKPDCLVLLIGSPAEAAVAGDIAASVAHPRLVNLAGKTRLDDLRALFPLVTLLVSNDSSPVHFASALGVRTVALFGATVPALGFGPLAAGSQSLGIDLGCRPCSDHGPMVCPLGHFRCLRDLSPAEVLRTVEAMLAAASAPDTRPP